jgi:hypothetical protein
MLHGQGHPVASAGPIDMSKLPSWRLARHAYLDVLANLQGLLQVGGLWLLMSWVLMMLGRSVAIFGAAADLAVAIGAAAIAVTWHRHILEDEPLTARFAPVDARVVRYFVLTVMLAVLVGVIPLALLLLLTGGPATPDAPQAGGGLSLLLVPAAMIASIYVAMRLQLIFPATAIGNQLTVTVIGSRNTTIIDSTQINNGNQTTVLNGKFDLQ